MVLSLLVNVKNFRSSLKLKNCCFWSWNIRCLDRWYATSIKKSPCQAPRKMFSSTKPNSPPPFSPFFVRDKNLKQFEGVQSNIDQKPCDVPFYWLVNMDSLCWLIMIPISMGSMIPYLTQPTRVKWWLLSRRVVTHGQLLLENPRLPDESMKVSDSRISNMKDSILS